MVSSHSCGSTATGQIDNIPKIKAAADANGFILILPDNPKQNCWDVGLGGVPEARRWRRHAGRRPDGEVRAHQVQRRRGPRLRDGRLVGGDDDAGVDGGLPGRLQGGLGARGRSGGMLGGWLRPQQAVEQQLRGRQHDQDGAAVGRPRSRHVSRATPDTARAFRSCRAQSDATISYKNTAESIKEWTNVLGLSTAPTSMDTGYKAASADLQPRSSGRTRAATRLRGLVLDRAARTPCRTKKARHPQVLRSRQGGGRQSGAGLLGDGGVGGTSGTTGAGGAGGSNVGIAGSSGNAGSGGKGGTVGSAGSAGSAGAIAGGCAARVGAGAVARDQGGDVGAQGGTIGSARGAVGTGGSVAAGGNSAKGGTTGAGTGGLPGSAGAAPPVGGSGPGDDSSSGGCSYAASNPRRWPGGAAPARRLRDRSRSPPTITPLRAAAIPRWPPHVSCRRPSTRGRRQAAVPHRPRSRVARRRARLDGPGCPPGESWSRRRGS